jgi:hypothetical protein
MKAKITVEVNRRWTLDRAVTRKHKAARSNQTSEINYYLEPKPPWAK